MIIVDTGFWVALFNNKDQYHLIAQQTLAQYSSQPLITTWCVLTESCHLLLQRSPNLYTGMDVSYQLIIEILIPIAGKIKNPLLIFSQISS
jgi:predicted nucleic acid-binding protein